MATESLNVNATEFRPQPSATESSNGESSGTRRASRGTRGKNEKSKTSATPAEGDTNGTSTDTPSTAPTAPPRQLRDGEAGNSTSLVPASVSRRRKPAHNKNSSAETSPSRGSGSGEGKASTSAPKPKKAASKNQQKQSTKTNKRMEGEEETESCLLCADPIAFHAVGECNHHGICSKCSLRMRMLMNDRSCPICKQNLERVVVSKEKRNFDTFQLWGDAAAGGRESVMDEASEIIFYECRSHYTTLRALRDYACRIRKCKVVCGSLQKLKDHLRIEHQTEFCELCVSHQHFFIQEQQVFTKNGLRMHNVGRNRAVGPKASGKDFHPMCQFCKRRFYSDMQLYEHLERDHFRCHMCKTDHDYFRNYSSLEAHFRREHFLCEDPSCLENRYVVFPNDIEYHAHMRNIHGVLNRLVLNFQVARSGENPLGGHSAHDDAPDSWNFESEDPSVTVVRQQETAFPALPTSTTPAPPPLTQPAIAPRAVVMRTSSAPASTGPPRAQIMRNQRLAEALGLSRPGQTTESFEEEMKTPNFKTNLVEWGKANVSYLQVVERRLERIVEDANCHSVSLRPMPAEERALMHQLAEFYGVPSQSFGEDPFRRLSFFKHTDAKVPEITLSKFLRGVNATRAASASASRLSFLPLRGQQPAQAPAPQPARPPSGINRGWEKIAPRPKRPVVADAWSDDEEEGTSPVNGSVSQTALVHDDDAEDEEEKEEKRPVPMITPVALDEVFDGEDDN